MFEFYSYIVFVTLYSDNKKIVMKDNKWYNDFK